MRVTLVELYGVGGTADYSDCLAQALAMRGHAVSLVTSSLFEPAARHPEYEVRRVFRYRTAEPKWRKALQLTASLPAVHAAVHRHAPDVVHAQGTVLPGVERHLYRALTLPRVCTVHDVESHEASRWRGSLDRFYATFDSLIFHSQDSQRRLHARFEVRRGAVIPHARYTPLATRTMSRAAARQRLGLDPDSRVILMFGYLRPYKGLEVLLDALRKALRSNAHLSLLVAGRPQYAIDGLVAATRCEGLPVTWVPRFIRRDDIHVHFAAADVVVLPYTRTGDSGMIELAAAFGKPVVVSDAGGLPEAFNRYGFGAVVPAGDARALAHALLDDYAARSPMRGGLSWDAVAAATEQHYVELATRGAPVAAGAQS